MKELANKCPHCLKEFVFGYYNHIMKCAQDRQRKIDRDRIAKEFKKTGK